MPKPWENASGYPDPTAYRAIQAADSEAKRVDALVRAIKYIVGLAGFELVARIELRDKRGRGREWR
jgi:hypothetical protein